ncbi:MAG: radical SAM protein [Ignavibacteria bacterium]|nr:radical SAM protein [Ignavibacteria bacterium]
MSKVLFTNSYFYKYDPKQWGMQQPYPPLGTIFAAALMRQEGFEVRLFDTNLINSPKEIDSVIKNEKPKYLVIYDDGFNYLTKMCLTNMRTAAFELCGIGKNYGCQVIVCSSDSSDHFDKYLDHNADYIVIGEGEITLKSLLYELEKNNRDLEDIPGLAFRSNGKTVITEKRVVLKDLDSLPQPAWDLVDMEKYNEIWVNNHGHFSLNIATTRGCPFKCNWCAKPIYGNRYNSRSPQNVVDEIEFLLNRYHPNHFWMCDDIFGLKPGWVQEFRDIVIAKGLSFKYKIQSRVDMIVKNDTIDALAESGLETAWVGAESGSQKILDAMDKGTTTEQIYQATKLLKEKGIKVAFFLQFGYIGETKEDIQKTIDMVLDLMPDEIGISVSYPLPGTKFYEKVKHGMKEKQNWTDSNDLALMFRSTFNSDYYKSLHRYVHAVYRKEKGYKNLQTLIKNPLKINKQQIKSAISTGFYLPVSYFQNRHLKKLELDN